MKRLLPLVLTAGLVILAGFLLVRVIAPEPAYDPLQAAAEARALEQAEALAPLDLLLAAAWRLVPLAAVVAALVVAIRWAWLRSRLVRVGGELVVLDHVPTIAPAVLAGNAAAQLAAAQRPNVPHSLTYSPHWSTRTESHSLEASGEPLALAAPAALTFAQLLDQGKVGKGNPLHLGIDADTGEALAGSWLDLYSTAVAGLPGSGKTTSQRFLACQTALHGAKFAVIDPHAGAADDSLAATLAPLASRFLCEPASSDRQILEVVRLVADIGKRRVQGLDSDNTPIILWADELTALLGRSSVASELGELLEMIAQEFRKKAVFCCASGQIWTAARTGSELRDSFASVLCHRMKRSQARLLLPTDEAERVERLGTGQAVLWRTSGEATRVSIPLTTAADVQRVAGLLTADAPRLHLATPRHTDMPKSSLEVAYDMPTGKPESSQSVAYGDLATAALGSGMPANAEALRAWALFKGGSDPAAIVQELRGVSSNQGKRYQLALAEVLNLIRQGAPAGH